MLLLLMMLLLIIMLLLLLMTIDFIKALVLIMMTWMIKREDKSHGVQNLADDIVAIHSRN